MRDSSVRGYLGLFRIGLINVLAYRASAWSFILSGAFYGFIQVSIILAFFHIRRYGKHRHGPTAGGHAHVACSHIIWRDAVCDTHQSAPENRFGARGSRPVQASGLILALVFIGYKRGP